MPYLKISFEQPLRAARAELERQYLEYHMSLHDRRIDEVRKVAGMNRSHLYRLAHKLGIFRDQYGA